MSDTGSGTESRPTEIHPPPSIDRLLEKLDRALDALAEAKSFAKSIYQTDVFQVAEALMAREGGIRALYSRAHRFDETGVFSGGAWLDPAKLQAQLVAGSLKISGVYPVVETLSELRMLAIAKDRATSDRVTAEDAAEFLGEVMALNLQFIFPGDTEQERIEGGPHRESNLRLFELLAEELDLTSLRRDVLAEIQQVVAQRPIRVKRVRRMIQMTERIPDDGSDPSAAEAIKRFSDAIRGPTPLSAKLPRVADYRNALREADPETLQTEATQMAEAMNETGLVCAHHAVLVRFLRKSGPELLATALGLNSVGAAELEQNQEMTIKLIGVAVLPATCQCLYGFARALERGLLSREAVIAGLTRIVDLDLQSDVRRALLEQRERHDGVSANAILLAGALSVLGQPLGIGQGNNPSCQAARGISLWSRHAPSYLLELVISAARDGLIAMRFEGSDIRSDKVPVPAGRTFDTDLDAVSLVLVPHLDRTYEEMLRRVALRAEDAHKWVNPGLYGRWVPSGFATVFADRAQTTVRDYPDFVRRFYATHHPAFNDGHTLMYPNPVGICVTNSHGDYLGPHAISLLRVEEDPHGILRAYFFNPNNEGRQDWGGGVITTIAGNGEDEGESSLPFHHFTSRLYAFHYNPYEEGDAFAVPDETVDEIAEAARNSWGKQFTWVD